MSEEKKIYDLTTYFICILINYEEAYVRIKRRKKRLLNQIKSSSTYFKTNKAKKEYAVEISVELSLFTTLKRKIQDLRGDYLVNRVEANVIRDLISELEPLFKDLEKNSNAQNKVLHFNNEGEKDKSDIGKLKTYFDEELDMIKKVIKLRRDVKKDNPDFHPSYAHYLGKRIRPKRIAISVLALFVIVLIVGSVWTEFGQKYFPRVVKYWYAYIIGYFSLFFLMDRWGEKQKRDGLRKDYMKQLENSLKNLKTDFIDNFFFHSGTNQ